MEQQQTNNDQHSIKSSKKNNATKSFKRKQSTATIGNKASRIKNDEKLSLNSSSKTKKTKKKKTVEERMKHEIGYSDGSQFSIVLCTINHLYPSVLSDMCTCYSKRYQLNRQYAELCHELKEEQDEKLQGMIFSYRYLPPGDMNGMSGDEMMQRAISSNFDTRPLLIATVGSDGGSGAQKTRSQSHKNSQLESGQSVQQLIEFNVCQILKRYLTTVRSGKNKQGRDKLRREYPWLAQLFSSFLHNVLMPDGDDSTLGSGGSCCAMLPIMSQLQFNSAFWGGKRHRSRESRAVAIHPMTQCFKSEARVRQVLKWKLDCHSVDQFNFYLLITKLFLDHILYQNFHLMECMNMMHQAIQLMSHHSFTHSFYTLNTNVTSKDFLSSILLPSKRLLSELVSYHLPMLTSSVERWTTGIINNRKLIRNSGNKNSTTETADGDQHNTYPIFYSIQHLNQWMREQSPKTKQETLQFKRTAISNILFLKFNPLKYPMTLTQTIDTHRPTASTIQSSFYSMFKNAATERENHLRRMQFIRKSKMSEISEEVYDNVQQRSLHKMKNLIVFKCQYLKYMKLQRRLQTTQDQLHSIMKKVRIDYAEEFNRLFSMYVRNKPSSMHIHDTMQHMSKGLSDRLQQLIIHHDLSSVISWMTRLSNKSDVFYRGVDQFREQITILHASTGSTQSHVST